MIQPPRRHDVEHLVVRDEKIRRRVLDVPPRPHLCPGTAGGRKRARGSSGFVLFEFALDRCSATAGTGRAASMRAVVRFPDTGVCPVLPSEINRCPGREYEVSQAGRGRPVEEAAQTDQLILNEHVSWVSNTKTHELQPADPRRAHAAARPGGEPPPRSGAAPAVAPQPLDSSRSRARMGMRKASVVQSRLGCDHNIRAPPRLASSASAWYRPRVEENSGQDARSTRNRPTHLPALHAPRNTSTTVFGRAGDIRAATRDTDPGRIAPR